MKQSNYLTLFLAPMAVLAGVGMAGMSRWAARACLLVLAGGGILLGALQQQSYRVFSSNSKALVGLMQAEPGAHVFGSTNNGNMVEIQALFEGSRRLPERFTYLSALPDGGIAQALESSPRHDRAYVVLDLETLYWGGRKPRLSESLPCWKPLSVLQPQGFGLGHTLLLGLVDAAEILHRTGAQRLRAAVGSLLHPRPATVYAVDEADPQCLGAGQAADKPR